MFKLKNNEKVELNNIGILEYNDGNINFNLVRNLTTTKIVLD